MISGHFRHLGLIVVVLLLGLAVANLNLPRIAAAQGDQIALGVQGTADDLMAYAEVPSRLA